MALPPAYGSPGAASSNSQGILYIRGDEFTDGSVRVTMTANDQAEVQRRTSGVWHITELEVIEALVLSNDLSLTFSNARQLVRK